MDRYEQHAQERDAQRYASTRLWHPTPNKLGVRGERATTIVFEAEADTRNRPRGDGGIDLWVLLRTRDGGRRWFIVDAKASSYGDWLRGVPGEVDPDTIYVLVHIKGDEETCVGWDIGARLISQTPIMLGDCGLSHVIKQPRPMSELLGRYCGWWRHEPHPDFPDHRYCVPYPARSRRAEFERCEDCGGAGLYVMFEGNVKTGKKMWFCEQHRRV